MQPSPALMRLSFCDRHGQRSSIFASRPGMPSSRVAPEPFVPAPAHIHSWMGNARSATSASSARTCAIAVRSGSADGWRWGGWPPCHDGHGREPAPIQPGGFARGPLTGLRRATVMVEYLRCYTGPRQVQLYSCRWGDVRHVCISTEAYPRITTPNSPIDHAHTRPRSVSANEEAST